MFGKNIFVQNYGHISDFLIVNDLRSGVVSSLITNNETAFRLDKFHAAFWKLHNSRIKYWFNFLECLTNSDSHSFQ